MHRREEDAHASSFGVTEERRAFRSDRVQHCSHVVYPFLERRELLVRHAVGEAGAAFVEEDEPREGGEPLEEVRHGRVVPHELDVRDPTGHVDEVARSLADDLVGNVHVAALRVAGLRGHRL
jgi:hypothetical protein